MECRKLPAEPTLTPDMAHRHDIQGLRAVAVLLVVLNHAGVPFLSGGYVGVDVFFVLSGFLITGLLLADAAKEGRVSLSNFYVRRARRILPAAALTLVATDVAAHHLLNFVRAREAVTDSIWASLFTANIHFARQGSDYFAQGQPPSAVQHFWTLAVEEQFYLVWPLVLGLVLFGVGFRRRRAQAIPRRALGRLLIVILAAAGASLAWSIHYTAVTPAAAYFSTFARAWELALGAALAIAASSLARVGRRVRLVLGWLGLGAMAASAVVFSESTAFPGYAALLPAAGAALVIGAGLGREQHRLGAGRVLSLAPFRYVGDRSYALYLWHWPILIIAVQYAGHELSTGARLVLMAGAFLLSILSYAAFENPIRRMRLPVPVGALLWPASAAVVLLVAWLTLGSIDETAARIDAAAAAVRPAALVDPAAPTGGQSAKPLPAVVAAADAARRGAPIPSPLTPSVAHLRGDFYSFPEGCAARPGQRSSKICRLGDTTSAKSIVVFGDSHAQMWMPTILQMARRDGWVVIPFVKDGCIPRSWGHAGWVCGGWYRWAKAHAAAVHPDVTLIADSWAGTPSPGPDIRAVGSLSVAMKRYSASVIVLGDAPHQSRDPTNCLLAPNATMKTCTTRATSDDLYADTTIAANARRHRIGFMDTRGWFCARSPGTIVQYLCPLVVNRTITCVDQGHISRTYGLELARPFRTAFRRELFR